MQTTTVKMVITGPFNSGKTQFVRAISEIDVVSTERNISSEAEKVKETTTVAMDFGRITVDDDLVLLPDERRIKVRGLHVHGGARPRASAGKRVAVNLDGACIWFDHTA